MLPVLELKAAIPVGMAIFGMDLWLAFFLAYIGSCLPAPLIIRLLKPIMRWIRHVKFLRKFFDKVVDSSLKRANQIRKYSLWGLFIFVAIPLPGTGVWTGSVISSAFDLRIIKATPVIWVGNLVAGLAILFLSNQIISKINLERR